MCSENLFIEYLMNYSESNTADTITNVGNYLWLASRLEEDILKLEENKASYEDEKDYYVKRAWLQHYLRMANVKLEYYRDRLWEGTD